MHLVIGSMPAGRPTEVRFFQFMAGANQGAGNEDLDPVESALPERHSEGILGDLDGGGVEFEPQEPEPPKEPANPPPTVPEPKQPGKKPDEKPAQPRQPTVL